MPNVIIRIDSDTVWIGAAILLVWGVIIAIKWANELSAYLARREQQRQYPETFEQDNDHGEENP